MKILKKGVANFSEHEGLFCKAKNVALRRQPTKGLMGILKKFG